MPQACDGSEPAPWSFGASGGGFDTEIVLDGERVHTRQFSTNLSVGRSMTRRIAWTVTASWVNGGTVEDRGVSGGGALAAGVSWLAAYETPRRPFVAVTGSAGGARVRARA